MGIEIHTEDKGDGHLRQVVVGAEVASWLWVLDLPMRLLGQTVCMGWIALPDNP